MTGIGAASGPKEVLRVVNEQHHFALASPIEIEHGTTVASLVTSTVDIKDEQSHNNDYCGCDPVDKKRIKEGLCVIVVVQVLYFGTVFLFGFYNDPRNTTEYNHYYYDVFIVTDDDIQDILELCTIDLLQSSRHGRQACNNACAVASCCHTSNITENCYANQITICKQLYACNLLKAIDEYDNNEDEGSSLNNSSTNTYTSASASSLSSSSSSSSGILVVLPPPPPDDGLLDHLCYSTYVWGEVGDDLSTTMKQCQDICENVKCCFPTFIALHPEYNCYDNTDDPTLNAKNICQRYDLCEYVYREPVGGTVDDVYIEPVIEPMTSGPIYDACDPSKINQGDEVAKLICVDLCINFQCCFIGLPNTGSCKSDTRCQQWGAPCEILYNSSYVRPVARPPVIIYESIGSSTSEMILPVMGEVEEETFTNVTILNSHQINGTKNIDDNHDN